MEPDTEARVVAMYEAGDKLIDITKATGLPRATIYWVLQRAGVQPGRVRKPAANAVTVIEVLDRLRETERYVGRLLALLDQHGIPHP
jgi:DNA invertase Pin-like site-specific DNA recombinase